MKICKLALCLQRGSLVFLLMGAPAVLCERAHAQAPEPAPPPGVPSPGTLEAGAPAEAPSDPVGTPPGVAPPPPEVVAPAPPSRATPAASAPGVVTAPPAGPAVEAAPPAVPAEPPPPAEPPKKEEHWYEKIKIRGYTQFRYNRIPGINRNDDLVNAQGDRFLGKNNGFGIRRARVIIYGDVHEHVSIYLQPDFASVIDDQLNVAIVRDWYADIFFDKAKTLRLRVGQSKVPYGFENMQSSQNRLPLDRNDALNSAVKDERDIGMFLYWAPAHIRDRFKYLVDSGLKGSGDYGVIGIGPYNGQTANRLALADHMHGVLRATWPFLFGEQFVELSAGGFWGKYRVQLPDDSTLTLPNGADLRDARLHGTVVVYPQPFGFQAEGTWGVGPSRGEIGDADRNEIKSRKLFGGYAQIMYMVRDLAGTVAFTPYVRATYYEGGKKFESNVPYHVVKELELGIEWQIWKALEVVLAYDMAERTVNDTQKGHVGRVQIQFNY